MNSSMIHWSITEKMDFNADSVLFNVKRWKDKPSTASISIYTNMTNIEKIDDYTVKMTLTKIITPIYQS